MSLELKLSFVIIKFRKKFDFSLMHEFEYMMTGKIGLIFRQLSIWNFLIVNMYSVTLFVWADSSSTPLSIKLTIYFLTLSC